MPGKLPWDSSERIDAFLQGIGRWLVFFVFFALLIGGAQLTSDGDPRWRIGGWVSMLVAFSVIVATIDRWARLLPALFAYAALHVVFMPFDESSAGNLVSVSSFERFVAFLILAACTALSISFYKRPKLSRVARACIVAVTIFCAVDSSLEALRNRSSGHLTGTGSYGETIFLFSGMLVCLLFNWGYDHFHRRVARK
jgi:hypothetical protein